MPEKRLKLTFNSDSFFTACSLQSLLVKNNFIYVSYVQQKKSNELSRCLITKLDGTFIKDVVVGNIPDTSKGIRHRIAEMLPYNDSTILITGNYLISSQSASGIVFCDDSLQVIKTSKTPSGVFYGSSSITGYAGVFQNMVALPTGSIIAGSGDYYINKPDSLHEQIACAISKLKPESNYDFDTTIYFFAPDENTKQTSMPSIHNLVYQKFDNRIYYVNTMNSDILYGCQGLSSMQVVSADTNLSVAWHKFITTNESTCPTVFYVASSDKRSGIDIIGRFKDYFNPFDTSLSSDFIIHVDSLGFLDVKSTEHFKIRDRIIVSPNPANNVLRVDDILNGMNHLEVYDMQGRRVLEQESDGKPKLIDISQLNPALYILRVRFKDGSNYSKSFIHD